MSEAQTAKPQTKGAFSAKTVGLIIGLSLFCFSAFLLLATYADDIAGGKNGREHALSNSAIGFAAIVRIMNTLEDGSATISRGPENKWERGLNVLTPSGWFNWKEDTLDEFVDPVLIVSPKWSTIRTAQKRDWVVRLGNPEDRSFSLEFEGYEYGIELTVVEDGESNVALRPHPDLDMWSGDLTQGNHFKIVGLDGETISAPVDHLQYLEPSEDLEPFLVDGEGRTILARLSGSGVYVLSDPDFLNTQGVANLERARTGVAILQALKWDGPITFDVTIQGLSRSRNFMKLLLEPPFSAATFAGLFGLILLAWRAAVRFGPIAHEERAFAMGKQALADNSAALIRMVSREHEFAPDFAELNRKQASHAAGAPRTLKGEELDAFLERRRITALAGDKGGDDYETLLTEAIAVHNRGALTAIAHKLFHWRQEIARERH